MKLPASDRTPYFPLGLQISARARERFDLPAELLGEAAGDMRPLQRIAQRLAAASASPASAAELNLLALLNRALRTLADRHLEAHRCTFAAKTLSIGGKPAGGEALEAALAGYVGLFPPAAVWRGVPDDEFLNGASVEDGHRETLIELFVLATQTGNAAAAGCGELFDDADLRRRVPYRELLEELDRRLQQTPVGGRLGRPLLALLRAPIEAAPDSLSDQVAHLRENWGDLLPEELQRDLLVALDILAEERAFRGFGPGPAPVPDFGGDDYHYDEPQAFSADAAWMPNVVLIAKSVHVWLDQLSRQYGRPVTRLDQIPDEELDRLVRWGFTSLWLIGIWERSPASSHIKQIMGNPEAAASAYSLYDYAVAGDLGGAEALTVLEGRCAARGICLASDVVPNHTGLYSRWLLEHPDWYVQLDHPPYAGYRFSGPDLSADGAVSLHIEDGYWDHSDAAVVFRHTDRRSGRVRYIYHGNDGTHMPWNDTAQLNYLLPEVREAMIRTIVGIARRFRVIRFDAAMTLAKKHYQRLWFPQPGGGAGVPSRAEQWMSREDFDRAFPVEFWREVVDRVAAEAPGTLLIAEAFWLMEGYFVRTLGMHRVYNSAFMNMLKQEENAKYRQTIKNILAFDPAILQRFVNFMNNPDEATAVEQFGKGDKYFGVATLLATMPGLPMFGHGQIEGLREKYGMEYRRAYWDESPDDAFIRHHEEQISPLLHRRSLFSGAERFELYDFWSGGHVDENVFAYSNALDGERVLVVYHNRNGETGGWLNRSVPHSRAGGGEPRPASTTLAETLGLSPEHDAYLRFRDHRSGLEYLLSARRLAEEGLHLSLGPYEYRVFLDFQQIRDADGSWGELCRALDGRPVADLDRELRKIRLAPLLGAFRKVLEAPLLQRVVSAPQRPQALWHTGPDAERFSRSLADFLAAMDQAAGLPGDRQTLHERMLGELDALNALSTLKSRRPHERRALRALCEPPAGDLEAGEERSQLHSVLLPFLVTHRLAQPAPGIRAGRRSAAWMEEFLLEDTLQETLGPEREEALLVKALVRHQDFWSPAARRHDFAAQLRDASVQQYLRVHRHDGTEWFSKERLEAFGYGLFFVASLAAIEHFGPDRAGLLGHIGRIHGDLTTLLDHAAQAGYRLAEFRALLRADQQALYPRMQQDGPLKILLVSSEIAPFAKSGGLADVAGSLPQALRRHGHDVRVIMPYYKGVAEQDAVSERGVASLEVDIGDTPQPGLMHRGELDGVPVYFVENRDYFDRDGLYGDGDGDYADNAERFGFFCRSVLEALPLLDFRPDVLHLNDWQTGLIPVLLRTELRDDPFYAAIGTLMTIHNLGYQGLFPYRALADQGLDPALASVEAMEYYGNISFLKGGLFFCDRINTVSETYCREIQTPAMGIGFDGILRRRRDALCGILNGLDLKQWNPAEDSALAAPYSAADLSGKGANKRALQKELGLTVDPAVPIVAMVTRLDTQKGLDLVEEAWEGLQQRKIQFVLLGTGERQHMERFARLRGRHPDRVSINLSFDEAFSRRIYAGSDLFLMPSRYEPCGLGQLIALRYGALPVVRRTGGLADTVTDPEADPKRGNGFVFDEPSSEALLGAVDRALDLYPDRRAWLRLVRQAMTRDFSWDRSAERYLEIYRMITEKRRG